MKSLLTINKILRYIDQSKILFGSPERISTIGLFLKEIESLSQDFIADKSNPSQQEESNVNCFKGDVFEIFMEIFFHIHSADPSVGIINYKPIPLTDDYGVDAIGTNVNGDSCAIQAKYRRDPTCEILLEDLAKTYSAGRLLNNVSSDNNDTLILFTTGKGVTTSCSLVFKNKLRVINRDIIAGFVDNNKTFWEEVENIVVYTLDNLHKEIQ